MLDGLGAAAREAGHVDSVAVDSWGVDFGLIDSNGRLVAEPRALPRRRRARAMDGVLARVPARELYERTGIQLMPINTVFELGAMAAEGDPALDAAETLLLIPDLLHYWLCGASTSEFTNATTTQCFDPHTGSLGGRPARAPRRARRGCCRRSSSPARGSRRSSHEVAEDTGLRRREVVAVATHDTGSAVAAVPFRRPGSVFISAGTWSLVGLEVDAPVITDAAFAANLTNEGGVDGTFRLLRNVTGLWLLHECRRAWAQEGREYSFDQLVALAKDAPRAAVAYRPERPAFADPGDMPARVRAFCAHTGQPEPVDPARSCAASSRASRSSTRRRSTCSPRSPASRRARSTSSAAVRATSCSAAGRPMRPDCRSSPGPEEATLLGNLLVQAMALGEIGSLAEAREVVHRRFRRADVYEPQETSGWHEARERFADASPSPQRWRSRA